MVATDGLRLSHIETSHRFNGLNTEVRVLVPKKALTEVERLLKEVEDKEEVQFARDDSHLFFKVGERLLISRLLSGQFPNYEAVLPRENKSTVVLARDQVASAIKRADLVALAEKVFSMVATGVIKPDVRQRYALADAVKAHVDLEAGRTTGPSLLMP